MTSWSVQVEAGPPDHPLTDDDMMDITHAVAGVCTFTPDRIAAAFHLDAPTLRQAVDQALRRAATGLPSRPHTIRVLPTDRYAAEVEHPEHLDLVGATEAAEILGVSRQRVGQLARDHAGFPAPIASLAAGPVYTRASIVAFDARWERRRTGRPRKTRHESV